MHDFAFVFAGFIVGMVVGLTGVGGGSLMTPLLIFVSNVKPHLAIGTDLLFAAFTKLGGTVRPARARVIDWRIVGQMAAGSLAASLARLYALQRLGPANPGSPDPHDHHPGAGAAADGHGHAVQSRARQGTARAHRPGAASTGHVPPALGAACCRYCWPVQA